MLYPFASFGAVLSAVAEGLDVAAAARVFGHGEGTIARWLARAGQHAERLHARLFRSVPGCDRAGRSSGCGSRSIP